jgi:hypothetical protein
MRRIVNPLPVTDQWALLSNGSIAIARAKDYHVDIVDPHGVATSGPRLPYEWMRLDDDGKSRIADSMRQFLIKADSIAKAAKRMPAMMFSEPVTASDLPDFYPPMRDRGTQADRDGNLWILPATSTQAQGGLLYDVVTSKGTLAERVQLPPRCALAGFAPGGIVYLNCSSSSEFHLKRTRVLR